MKDKEFAEKFKALQQEHQLSAQESYKTRAQAITVGPSAGGCVELTMRTSAGNFVWHLFQPVQAVELIHQMAAAIGCHINIQPRDDFASWREWKKPESEKKDQLNGHPPFSTLHGRPDIATGLPEPDKQIGINHQIGINTEDKKDAVPTKKHDN